MASGFAPEFLILIGVDVFLGGSILTVLLDKHFPPALPYVLDAGAMIGFGELLAGPSFVTSLSTELQFYYSFAYAMIGVLTLFALNLYLLFLRRRPYESAMLGVFATVPSALGMLYFTSAFVNGLTISLPMVPEIPIQGVYILFGISVGLIVFSLVVFGRKITEKGIEMEARPALEEPIPARSFEVSEGAMVSMAAPPSGPQQATPKTVEPVAPPSQPSPDAQPPQPSRVAAAGAAEPAKPAEVARPAIASTTGLQEERREYAKRLRDSIDFFGKAVKGPVRINPATLQGTFRDVKKAYLTAAGMVLVEDSAGKTTSRSLLELSTDEALQVMTEAMKGLDGGSAAS